MDESRFESAIDEQIRRAQERGDFDNLPGAGKPLPGRGDPDDENWWLRQYLRREGLPSDALLPESLQLAREIGRLPEQVRQLPSEQAVRQVVADLNRRIAQFLRAPSGPAVPVRPVNTEDLVRQWRQAWQLEEPAGHDESHGCASRRRTGAHGVSFENRDRLTGVSGMGIGASIFLIALGALLVFAVDYQLWWLDLTAAGWVLMVVGVLGLLLTFLLWSRRRNRQAGGDLYEPGSPPPP